MASNYPMLLVLHEKYGDEYYLIQSDEDLHKAAAKTIIQRNEEGWYPKVESVLTHKRDSIARVLEKLSESDRALLKLETDEIPEALKETAAKLKRDYNENVQKVERNFASELQDAELIERLVKSSTPESETITGSRGRELNLAYTILNQRSSGEYEDFSLETFKSVD